MGAAAIRFRPLRPAGIVWKRSLQQRAFLLGARSYHAFRDRTSLACCSCPRRRTRAPSISPGRRSSRGSDGAPVAEKTAVTVLVEEAEKRTGIRWPVAAGAAEAGAVIVATSKLDDVAGGIDAPEAVRKGAAGLKPEGFVLAVDARKAERPVVWVVGADARGVLFGVGKLLRTMKMAKGSATLDARTHVATSPAYPIRGHQLGYRNRANSWDAWDEAQFDQYIRELAIFGANCVENIPFQDDAPDARSMRGPAQGDERPDERDLRRATTRTTGSGPPPTST